MDAYFHRKRQLHCSSAQATDPKSVRPLYRSSMARQEPSDSSMPPVFSIYCYSISHRQSTLQKAWSTISLQHCVPAYRTVLRLATTKTIVCKSLTSPFSSPTCHFIHHSKAQAAMAVSPKVTANISNPITAHPRKVTRAVAFAAPLDSLWATTACSLTPRSYPCMDIEWRHGIIVAI